MNALKTVLIVDGHAGVRTALAYALDHTPGLQVVGAVGTLDDAVVMGRDRAPDVVIYEPRTVAADAVTALTVLTALGRPVVVLTSTLHDDEAATFWRAGAAAILLKGCSLAVLLQAIETVLTARDDSPA